LEALLVVNIKYAPEKVFMTEKRFAFLKKELIMRRGKAVG